MPDLPPLDDILGRKVQLDGYEWTIRYSEATKRVVLERPLPGGMEAVLKALRDGVAVLANDPTDVSSQPLPTKREAAGQEWLYLDALIAGARAHGTLAPPAIELLEQRLAQLTEFLKN